MFGQTLGRLLEERKRSRLTQEELARVSGWAGDDSQTRNGRDEGEPETARKLRAR